MTHDQTYDPKRDEALEQQWEESAEDSLEEDAEEGEEEAGANIPALHVDAFDVTAVVEEATDGTVDEFRRTGFIFPRGQMDYSRKEKEERAPLGWVNRAVIAIDPEGDSVTASISVGEARGAFEFTIRRLPNGELVMHVPYPGQEMPHCQIRLHHEGTYDIIK